MRVLRPLSPSVPVILVTAALLAPACRCARTPDEPRDRNPATTSEALTAEARPAELPTHARGMWVWSVKRRLAEKDGVSSLVDTVRAARLDEVYLGANESVLADERLPELLAALAALHVRVEALVGDAHWYRPERRSELLGIVDRVATYNASHPARFAAMHFDIEPHQLPENKGRHPFLPALADALRAARERANAHGMTTSADLPRFAFEGEHAARFASAVERPFLMQYELRDASSVALVRQSGAILEHTYASVPPEVRGRMVIGLRVPDYGAELEARLQALDDAYAGRAPRFGGWAIHDEAAYRARGR